MVPAKWKRELIATVNKHAPQTRIYLFGSRAKTRRNTRSDIDIALDFGAPLSTRIIGNIKEDLAQSHIPYFVDIVDVHMVSQDMYDDIMRDGIVWKS